MLLVASPRYSESSLRSPPSITTTPMPAGPGLPVHAPSVHTAIASSGTLPTVASAVLLLSLLAGAGSPASISIGSPGSRVRLRTPAR